MGARAVQGLYYHWHLRGAFTSLMVQIAVHSVCNDAVGSERCTVLVGSVHAPQQHIHCCRVMWFIFERSEKVPLQTVAVPNKAIHGSALMLAVE